MFEWTNSILTKELSFIQVPGTLLELKLFLHDFFENNKSSYKTKQIASEIYIDKEFLYLMAFSDNLQAYIFNSLTEIISEFSNHSKLVSKIFFYLFKLFVEEEKKNKNFKFVKFDSKIFFRNLKQFSLYILKIVLFPNR